MYLYKPSITPFKIDTVLASYLKFPTLISVVNNSDLGFPTQYRNQLSANISMDTLAFSICFGHR